MKTIVVAGIGTGIGKTIVSAILVEALKADYWKPVQAGDLENSDTVSVKSLTSNADSYFHTEAYRLTKPMSPHAAAKLDGVRIELEKFDLPKTENNLLIELAGGLMVPLNSTHTNLDLLKKWHLPVLLVSRNYLGSINHTLLSVEVLKQHQIPILGIIFNGIENKDSEAFILDHTRLKCIARIPELEKLSKEEIGKAASLIPRDLLNHVTR